ncbi:unnamed protein product [Protopolystoma xenopodis]|uniref:Uncharacterized protein n=1 Tax=Protopolystoma xenopodis TaxID=117903 RepID=A0A448WVB9_9PLAT|nr:unnamed protein product [Protopolystoma xenopodis]
MWARPIGLLSRHSAAPSCGRTNTQTYRHPDRQTERQVNMLATGSVDRAVDVVEACSWHPTSPAARFPRRRIMTSPVGASHRLGLPLLACQCALVNRRLAGFEAAACERDSSARRLVARPRAHAAAPCGPR